MDEGLLNDLLECSVCLERLDTSSRVLPCQHTFCIKCLKEIVQSHKELRCPECRILVDVRVEDLPPNVLLMRILEGMKGRSSGVSSTPVKPSPNHQQTQYFSGAINPSHHPQYKIALAYNYNKPNREKDGNSQGQDVGNSCGVVPSASPSQVTRPQHGEYPVPNVAPHARALYDYLAKDPGNLSFKKGDIIYLRKRIDTHWCYGEVGGNQGAFPINYTQVIVPLPASTVPQCKALYDFRMAAPDEDGCLAFDKGALITVIRRVDENWAEGRLNDKIGIFPIAFVEMNAPARALMKISANLSNRGGVAMSQNEPIIGGPAAQARTDKQMVNTYHQQPMSLSSPIPASLPTVPGPHAMSQSHPAPATLPPNSSAATQISSIVEEPDPRNEPDIIQLVYGSHANAAQLLVQSLQAANSNKHNHMDAANIQANIAGQEAYQKAKANIKQFQCLSSSYHATNNLVSDSSSSTTPSFGGSSVTTTPNISSSNTSSSESNTPSSPASPATNVHSGNSRHNQSGSKHNYQNVVPPLLNTSGDTSLRSQETSLESSGNNTVIHNSGMGSTLNTAHVNNSVPNISMESSPRSNMSSPQAFSNTSTSSPMIIHPPLETKCSQQQQQHNNSGLYVNTQPGVAYNPLLGKVTSETIAHSEDLSKVASPRHTRDGQVAINSRSGYHPHHREKRHSLTPGTVASPSQSTSTPNRHSMEYMLSGNNIASVAMRPEPATSSETQMPQAQPSENARKHDSKRERDVKLPAPHVALYPYKPQKSDELELKKGVVYTVVERCYDGWYKGFLNSNSQKCGVFPGNYVAPAHSKSKHRSSKTSGSADGKTSGSKSGNNSTNGPSSTRGDDNAVSAAQSTPQTSQTLQPPDLPPRASSPNNSSFWSSTPKPSSSKSSEKTKEKSKCEKTPTSMSFMKRLTAMKKSKSPPPAHPQAGFSMDNPVFEDCSVPPTQQPVHVRSGSCPSQLLQTENIESTSGGPHATVGPAGGVRIINSNRTIQTVGPAHAAGPRVRTRPSLINATLSGPPHQSAQSGDGPWQPVSSSNRPQHQHRKSHSLDAGQQLRTRDSTTTRERFRCIAPYPPNSEYELELQVDDVVVVHRKWGDGWYKGTHEKTGRTGLFPASFVEAC